MSVGGLFSDLVAGPVDTFAPDPPGDDPWGGEDTGGESLPPPVSAPQGKTAQCEVCGVDIPLTPTGRIPRVRLCEDHKGNAPMRTRPVSNTPRGKSKMDARLQAVVDDLQKGAGELAGTIAPVAPVAATYTLQQAPGGIEALVRIASDHPKMLEGLEVAAKAVPFMTVGKFVAGLILAVSVDMGQYRPHGLAAEYLGVAQAADAVGWTPPQPRQATPDTSQANGARVVAPPAFKL